MSADPSMLLRVESLSCSYPLPRRLPWQTPGRLSALREVSFTVASGSSLGIVGESGSGKSTLARTVMALQKPDAGRVLRALKAGIGVMPSYAERMTEKDMLAVAQFVAHATGAAK